MDKQSADKIEKEIKTIMGNAHMGNLNGIETINVSVKAEIPRIKLPPNIMVSQAFAKIASSNLTPVSCKLLIWLFGITHFENYVSIDIDSMAEELRYSPRNVLRAFKELVANNILQKFPHPTDKRRNDYFLNPFAAWKGNSFSRLTRIKLYEEKSNSMTLFDMSEDEEGYQELHQTTPTKKRQRNVDSLLNDSLKSRKKEIKKVTE